MSPPDATAALAVPVDGSGFPWWSLAVLGLVGVAFGALAGYVIAGRRPGRVATGAPVPTSPAPPPIPEPALDQLIGAVIDTRDLAEPSTVMARRLGGALSGAGVSEFAPLGQPYDPAAHYAVGTAPAPAPASADLIAEVQRVGYLRDNEVIRAAEVVVFRLEPVR